MQLKKTLPAAIAAGLLLASCTKPATEEMPAPMPPAAVGTVVSPDAAAPAPAPAAGPEMAAPAPAPAAGPDAMAPAPATTVAAPGAAATMNADGTVSATADGVSVATTPAGAATVAAPGAEVTTAK